MSQKIEQVDRKLGEREREESDVGKDYRLRLNPRPSSLRTGATAHEVCNFTFLAISAPLWHKNDFILWGAESYFFFCFYCPSRQNDGSLRESEPLLEQYEQHIAQNTVVGFVFGFEMTFFPPLLQSISLLFHVWKRKEHRWVNRPFSAAGHITEFG